MDWPYFFRKERQHNKLYEKQKTNPKYEANNITVQPYNKNVKRL